MANYQYVVLSCIEPGREADFAAWYDGRHLADVARVPGVVSARRYPLLSCKAESFAAPQWRSLAIYEIESDDPDQVLAEITERYGTDDMPFSDALSMIGLVEMLVGEESGRA